MGLCNVYSYLNEYDIGKTVKLSDSYQVRIRLNDEDFAEGTSNHTKSKYALRILQPENNEIELAECTSVNIPSYKPKEDIFTYGNNSKSFIYMDPKSLEDLEIELIEHYNNDNTLFVENFVNLCLSKLFDEDKFQYKLDDYIPELTVYVFSNIFNKVYIKYVFQELKLTDYTKYNLEYSSTDIAKWTLKFSYRTYYAVSVVESDYEIYNRATENTVSVENLPVKETAAPNIATNAPTTDQEDLKNAETNLENLKKTKTLSLDKEQKELQDIKQQRETLQKQLEEKKNSLAKNEADAAKFEQERQEASATKFKAEEEKRQQEQSLFGLGSVLSTAGYDDRIKAANTWENRALNDRTNARKQANADRDEITKLEAQLAELDKKESATTKSLNDKKAKNDAITKEVDKNTALKNEFNSAGEIPTGNKTTNNLVDLTKLSNEDRTDELAYRMMRGELDNGKPRYGRTYDAGYTEEERATAQKIVNQKDWQGLKERHDARVAAISQEIATELEAPSIPQKQTEITQTEPTPVEKIQTTKSSSINSYQNDTGTKYINGEANENGLTINQWAYISAKRDFEEETNKQKRDAADFRGINFSVGATNLPMKEKMNFQKKYREEMKKQQSTEM